MTPCGMGARRVLRTADGPGPDAPGGPGRAGGESDEDTTPGRRPGLDLTLLPTVAGSGTWAWLKAAS